MYVLLFRAQLSCRDLTQIQNDVGMYFPWKSKFLSWSEAKNKTVDVQHNWKFRVRPGAYNVGALAAMQFGKSNSCRGFFGAE